MGRFLVEFGRRRRRERGKRSSGRMGRVGSTAMDELRHGSRGVDWLILDDSRNGLPVSVLTSRRGEVIRGRERLTDVERILGVCIRRDSYRSWMI